MKHKVIVFVVAFLIFLSFQFTYSDFSDPDAYYHIAMAEIAPYPGGSHFPWLSATTLRDGFADQHLLYHVLLRPFVALHRTAGAKVATALCSAGVVTVFFWFLQYLGVPFPAFWTAVAFLSSRAALYRINLVKANTLSLLLLLVAMWAMMEGRWKTLFVIAAIFIWTYGGFVFLPVLAILYTAVQWAHARKFLSPDDVAAPMRDGALSQRGIWQPLSYTLAGILLGLWFHPQFPAILSHMFNQTFQVGLNRPATVTVGAEWTPYSVWTLLLGNLIALPVWLLATVVWVRRRQWTRTQVFTFLVSVFFLILTVRWRRFAEYWPPLAVLFAAVSVGHDMPRKLKDVVQVWKNWQGGVILAGGIVLLCVFVNIGGTIFWLREGRSAPFKNASGWLAQHAKEGDIVFHTQWGQFPQLFFWNRRTYYIVGLDPTFLYIRDPGLYWQWRHISDDEPGTCQVERCGPLSSSEQEQSILRAINEDFHASYVLLEKKQNPRLQTLLDNHPTAFEKVYEDQEAVLYKRSEKGNVKMETTFKDINGSRS